MRKRPLVYFGHLMEGLKIPEESGARGLQFRELVKDYFDVWLPEELQVSKDDQQDVDLDALEKSDILIVDCYHYGMKRHGEKVMGKGTMQEVGFVKGLNAARLRKKVPIIQILRETKFFHCFDVPGRVTKNCGSLEHAAKYVIRQYGKKKK